MKDENTNYYSYSAAENSEIRKIREKYENADHKDSKVDYVKKLDRSVHNTASSVSIAIGIIGSLIFGFGLTCVLEWAGELFVPGIVIGVIGMVISLTAYPVYKRVYKKKKEEIAPEILRLTEELLK